MYLCPGGQSGRIQPQKTQFESWEAEPQHPIYTADVVNPWSKTNDGGGGSPNWAISSDIWLLLIALAKILGRDGSM